MAALTEAGEPVEVIHLAVRDLPGSGKPVELLAAVGIAAADIAQAARELLGR
jgi:transketolase